MNGDGHGKRGHSVCDVGRLDWEGPLAHCSAYSLSGNIKSLLTGRPRLGVRPCMLCETEATASKPVTQSGRIGMPGCCNSAASSRRGERRGKGWLMCTGDPSADTSATSHVLSDMSCAGESFETAGFCHIEKKGTYKDMKNGGTHLRVYY